MTKQQIWQDIEIASRKDRKENPSWPDHAAGQAGKVVSEAGGVMTAAMKFKYGGDNSEEVYKELMRQRAIKTAVMAIRFLENLK